MANDVATLAARGWVSLAGFARLAGVSYPTALRLKKQGYINVIPVGGLWRVYTDEVERFLREGNAKPASTANEGDP